MSMESSDFGPRKYKDGITKQSFKDSTDINKMLKKAQKQGSLAHLIKYPEAVYGEFDGETDLLTATQRIGRAGEIFADLPSEVRREYGNDPIAYVTDMNRRINAGEDISKVIPQIAEPGSYFPNPVQRGGQGAGVATAPNDSAPAAATETTPASPPAGDGAQAAPDAPPVD
jgi:hypothetical protein